MAETVLERKFQLHVRGPSKVPVQHAQEPGGQLQNVICQGQRVRFLVKLSSWGALSEWDGIQSHAAR